MTSHAESFSWGSGSSIPSESSQDESRPAILPTIKSPADIKALPEEALPQLAAEVRRRIIEVIAVKGGHFGAPLGAVDIAVALLRVYNLPEDRVAWDTGHQGYAWKILTGRNEQFDTIRQYEGLSPFLKRKESEYDHFGAGHASTSIAAAYGFALARDLTGKDNKVVAVIGDGAMTGGLAYEALNNAGLRQTDMTLIFNDNEMSISDNVWAVHKSLSTLITDKRYNAAKKDIKKAVKALMGDRIVHAAHKMEEALKGVLVPGLFFEELGFRYVGPVDGHDLTELIPMLERVRALSGPVCLHVITKKGKGYSFAENDPIKYHAAANMKIETGEMTKGAAPPAYTKVFGQTLVDLARKNKRIAAITAAMPQGTGTDIFQAEFPDRFFDVGIAEECAIVMAAGMAADGVIPVAAIYSTFLQRAFDQIIHDVGIQSLPVRFVLDRAGLVGADGPTHHGVFDLSYLRMVPGMVVMAPRNEQELRRMLVTQIEHSEGPSAMRYPRGSSTGECDLNEDYPALEIGKGEVLRRGEKIALLGIGKMTLSFLEAAELIEAELGHSVTVADARFVKPLDREMILELAESHDFLFTCEDNALEGGFGSAVNEMLQDAGAPRLARRFGIPDRFVEHGEPEELYKELGLLPEQLADRILEKIKPVG